jgi:hypothetical protein
VLDVISSNLNLGEGTFIQYSAIFTPEMNIQFLVGEVITVLPHHVVFRIPTVPFSTQVLHFDVLVVATGCKYSWNVSDDGAGADVLSPVHSEEYFDDYSEVRKLSNGTLLTGEINNNGTVYSFPNPVKTKTIHCASFSISVQASALFITKAGSLIDPFLTSHSDSIL